MCTMGHDIATLSNPHLSHLSIDHFFPYRGAGMTLVLAPVTHDNETFIISNYTGFLNSSELVRGAILVSTGLCSVADMTIRTAVSIREVSEGM